MVLTRSKSAAVTTTFAQLDDTSATKSLKDWKYGNKRRKSKPKGQPSLKRVKVVDDANTSSKTTTIMRRQNNNSSILLSMPLDVIFAVFLALNIKDLVVLTCTSQSLRDVLLWKNVKNIWRTVRENSRVPEPPHDFSEQQWASFLFGSTICQCCGTPGIYTIDFYLRRRLCIRCKLDNYITESSLSRSLTGPDKTLLKLIPHSDVLPYGHASSSRFYWKKDTENIIRRWNELKSGSCSFKGKQQLEDFCKERKEFVETILQEGKIYMEWSQRESQELSDQSREWKNAICATIYQRFCDLGYEKCDMLGIEGEGLTGVTSELTDAGWARIRPGLEQTIIKARDRRHEFERQRCREKRLHTFKKLFDAHCLTVLPAVWLQYPYWRDIATFPEFSRIIDYAGNVNEDSFAPAMGKLPSLIERWLEDKRATLKQELYNSLTTIHSSMTNVLDLATAIFKCAGDGCRQNIPLYAEVSSNPLFGWDDASRHMCSSYNSLNTWYFIPTYSTYTKTVITLFEEASVVAARLVRLVGLDPRCTTIADMDRSGFCFFCSGCPKSQDRQKAYPWRAAVAHGASHKHQDEPAWQVLTSAQMLELEVSENPNNQFMCWSCNHCSVHLHALENVSKVRNHVVSEHNIENPREPTDLFCCRRVSLLRLPLPYWSCPPVAGKHHDKDVRCKHCYKVKQPRLFNLIGVKSHLKDKHGINSPRPITDYIHL